MTQPRILLVEDEENLMHAVKLNLELEGFEVAVADNGAKALKRFKEQRFNLIILDIMLPEMDGYQVCQSIRSMSSDIPILFLTAKDTSEDKITGFKAGGDDYLTKPFNLDELLMRAHVLVRHSLKGTAKEKSTHIFRFGNNEINFQTLVAKGMKNKKIELKKREAALMKLLIDKKNEVVTREQILQTVWGYDVFPSTRSIDNYMTSFRRYFEKDTRKPRYFHSIRGMGYKFTENG